LLGSKARPLYEKALDQLMQRQAAAIVDWSIGQ
jgi:hypothetical protein